MVSFFKRKLYCSLQRLHIHNCCLNRSYYNGDISSVSLFILEVPGLNASNKAKVITAVVSILMEKRSSISYNGKISYT